ncbi:MAG: UPF0175 family protein [Caldimicrobium sp.]
MSIIIIIPEEIVEALKIPSGKVEQEIKKELALALYENGIATLGISRKLSGLSKWEFLEEIAKRGILRHYSETDLEEDITYAKSSL